MDRPLAHLKPSLFLALTLGITSAHSQVPKQLQNMPPHMREMILRQMAEQGIQLPAQGGRANPSSAQGNSSSNNKLKLLGQLTIDRTNAGILEARLKAARQAEQKAAPPEEEETPAAATKREIEQLQLHLTLGNWKAASTYLSTLKENEVKTAYSRILSQLSSSVTVNPRPELAAAGARAHRQDHYLRPNDILALADLTPQAPTDQQLKTLSSMLAKCEAPTPAFYQELKTNSRHFGNQSPEKSTRTAKFLLDATKLDEAFPYLPTPETAKEKKDYTSLNMIARWHASAHRTDKGSEHLPIAWKVSLDLVGNTAAPHPTRAEALYRALSLVPELEGETGTRWLNQTFAKADGEAFEILSTVGVLAAQVRQHNSPHYRFEQIKLQHAAAKALIEAKGIDLKPWREILTLYARNWNHEAAHSHRYDQATTMRPSMQFDAFGNPYYVRSSYASSVRTTTSGRNRRVPTIDTGDLLRARPSEEWLKLIDSSVRTQSIALSTRLLLKVKENQKALPLLEQLATIDKKQGAELVREMISVWAENNNPNQRNQYRSSYYYFSGYNQRAETIPLTRSKQERNLRELAKLIQQVKNLKLGETFDDEFADAFIACHSQAEVWRVEALQQVFGNLKELSPKTAASLLRRMRGNLTGLWPNPKLQQQAKTKRKDKELRALVLRGYQTANDLCADVLAKHPDSWELELQQWALMYEESNYRASLGSHPDHSAKKRRALDGIARVAAAYTATLPLDDSSDESLEPFTTWFYAALGSPNLGALKNHHQPIPSEFPLIKKALNAIPEKCRARHLSEFANTLNTRLANVGADLKYRFLENALPITGEHERIEEATKIFQYYQDLVTEIELDVKVDGPDTLNAEQPFGLAINLRHTREIERESGGFQRYLVNQNNSPYAYNYGRPTEDYRDKFEKAARAALQEHFEVISVIFHSSKVTSHTDPEPGWTVTPYAYILLKPKGPHVDSVPPLKIDLDFLDTSGYVVLPIASAAIPISATGKATQRPHRDIKLTMTLDERESKETQKLALEVSISGHGLVPELGDIIDLNHPGYSIEIAEDNDMLISELDATAQDFAPISTRDWRLILTPDSGKLPADFTFPTVSSKLKFAEEDGLTLQQYQDVDLIPATETLKLGAGNRTQISLWWLLLLIIPIGLILWLVFRKKPEVAAVVSLVPDPPNNLNPVSAIAYLKRVHQDGKLDDSVLQGLLDDIQQLESQAFSPGGQSPSQQELEKLTTRWKERAA